MPLVDMSLERLREYKGINPKPADFEEYWDKALSELDKINPDPQFKPYGFSASFADAYELTFTSTRNARIYVKFLKPAKTSGKHPAVIVFHGLGGSSPSWFDLLAYVAEGYVVAAMDTRGQGGYSEDVGGVPGTTFTTPFMRGIDGEPEDLYCKDIFLDTALIAKIVMGLDYVDETRVAVTGGSQGGALSVACAALVPEIKICAPQYPYYSDYKRVWNMDLAKGAYEGIRYYFRSFDPRHEREDELFERLGYIDLHHLAPRIKAKYYMGTGLMDVVCPPSTQFAIYNNLTCEEKEVVIYPDFGHEALKGHNDKIFEYIVKNI